MKKKKVMMVDDEEAICKLVQLNLEKTGLCQVKYCVKASEAIALAKDFLPDIILLDIVMPELEGMTVKSKLREQPELMNVPVVFLTAIVTDEEAKRQSEMDSGNMFVAKPVKTEKLLELIVNVT